jgi:hypothetical protein
MTKTNQQRIKEVYDNTAALIAKLYIKGDLSLEERDFLAVLLDIMIFRPNYELINALKEWQSHKCDEEINSIIKATLLAADFQNPESVAACINSINELLAYAEKA